MILYVYMNVLYHRVLRKSLVNRVEPFCILTQNNELGERMIQNFKSDIKDGLLNANVSSRIFYCHTE